MCGLTHIFWQDALSPTTARFIQKQWHWRVSVSPVKLEERCSADHHESMDRIHSTTAAVLDKCSLTREASASKPFCKRITLHIHAFKNKQKQEYIQNKTFETFVAQLQWPHMHLCLIFGNIHRRFEFIKFILEFNLILYLSQIATLSKLQAIK